MQIKMYTKYTYKYGKIIYSNKKNPPFGGSILASDHSVLSVIRVFRLQLSFHDKWDTRRDIPLFVFRFSVVRDELVRSPFGIHDSKKRYLTAQD